MSSSSHSIADSAENEESLIHDSQGSGMTTIMSISAQTRSRDLTPQRRESVAQATQYEEQREKTKADEPLEINMGKFTAEERTPMADKMMWLDFEQKVRILMMNMINPVAEVMTKDRITVNHVVEVNKD